MLVSNMSVPWPSLAKHEGQSICVRQPDLSKE
jgi:hypothetical protein